MVKISFILAIYNAERTMEECLNGVYIQNFNKKEFEVIIIDGGSTDDTKKIIDGFKKRHSNIYYYTNKYKLSEGKGMGKDQGVSRAKGEYLIFLDHDNILTDKNWLKKIVSPFNNKNIMAVQSLLSPIKGDTLFLKYINHLGIEDPFATPYSLVAQNLLNSSKFKHISTPSIDLFNLSKSNILFFGANGCAFRKKVFKKIGGYTRDVDVSAVMAQNNMVVAIPRDTSLYHKTANTLLQYLVKKGRYYHRFIDKEYSSKSFKWAELGSPPSNLRFFIQVLLNLAILPAFLEILPLVFSKKSPSLLLHPFYVFIMTLEYGLITLPNIRNFFKYL